MAIEAIFSALAEQLSSATARSNHITRGACALGREMIFVNSDDCEDLGQTPHTLTAAAIVLLSIISGAAAGLLIHSNVNFFISWPVAMLGVLVALLGFVLLKKQLARLPHTLRLTGEKGNRTHISEQEHLNALQNLINGITALMGVVELRSEELIHVYSNPSATEFLAPLDVEGLPQEGSQRDLAFAFSRELLAYCRACRARRAPLHFEFRAQTPPGTRWFSVSIAPLLTSGFEPHQFAFLAEDITKLKRTESLLTETKDRLAAALEQGALGTWDWDISCNVIYGDATLIKLFDFAASYLRGVPIEEFINRINQEDRERVQLLIQHALLTGERYTSQFRITTQDGKTRWLSATGKVVYDENQKPYRFPGVSMDITHLKQIEEALHRETTLSRKQLAELEAVYTYAPVGLCVFDNNKRWTRINKIMAASFGQEPSENIGKSVRDVLPSLANSLEGALDRVIDTKQPVLNIEFSGESPKVPGTVRTWTGSFYPLFNGQEKVQGISVVTEDITEARRSSEEHLAHRTILEKVAAQAPLEKILYMLACAVERIFPGAQAYIVQDYQRGEQVVLSGDGYSSSIKELFAEPLTPDPSGVFSKVISNREEVLIPDITRSGTSTFIEKLRERNVRSLWVRPITLSDGSVWGACAVQHQLVSLKPTQSDKEHLEVLLKLAATVIERKRFYEQLTATSQRLQYAETVGKIGVFDWDIKTGALVWTAQMEEIFGIPGGSFEGDITHWKKRLHPDDAALVLNTLDTLIHQREPIFKQDYRIVHPNGEVHWISVQGAFEYDQDGSAARMIGVGTDITEQKRTEEQSRLDKERLILALESGALGFWDWNIQTGDVFFGGCWASMLGYAPEELEPSITTWERLIHHEDKLTVDKVLEAHLVRETPLYEAEFRLKKRDGTWLWVLSRGRVVARDPEGAPLRVVGVHANVHEQHLIRDELRAAAKRKDEFLATLAHELRNPLAPLRTGLEIIRRAPAGTAAIQARDMMDRQLLHMVRLVDDLLDVSRITRGMLELKRSDITLRNIIQVAVESSMPAIEIAHHQLSINLPTEEIIIHGDATRLSQVMSNLLLNAAKYTPDRGLIQIEASMKKDSVVVAIRDNGLGIPEEMISHVFEMFGQVNQTLERSQGGLGIGLALVRNIVELHGGKVQASSPGVGKGSTFTVELPAKALAVQVTETSTHPATFGEEKMKKVLIVDDNIDGAMSLKLYLELLGHPVSVAHTGPDAVAQVTQEMPEVIFLDIGLPGMSGYEVAQRIRQMPAGKAPVIAAVTGWGTDEDKRRSAEAGCNVHLTKPIDMATAEKLLA